MLKIKRNTKKKTIDSNVDLSYDPLSAFENDQLDTAPNTQNQKTKTKPSTKKERRFLLNTADYTKMQSVIHLSLFLLLAFLYFVTVMITVSGLEVSALGLSSMVFSRIHFVMYVIFVYALARMITSFAYFFGQKYTSNDILGISVQVIMILVCIFLYLRHFRLGFLFEKLLVHLPF